MAFKPLPESEKLRRLAELDAWLAERRRQRERQLNVEVLHEIAAAKRQRVEYIRKEQDERAELHGGA